MTKYISLITLVTMATLAHSNQAAASPKPQLRALFDEYWEYQMRTYPTLATYQGDKRYDSLLTDLSPEARKAGEAKTREFLDRLKKIDLSQVDDDDRVSADMFELTLNRAIEAEPFKNYTMPIDQQDGPHLDFPNLLTAITFQSEQDYINFYKRMLAFPKFVDQTISDMREGMQLGLVATRINIEPVLTQIESFVIDDPSKSVFYQPITENKAKLGEEQLARLGEQYKSAIKNSVIPAYVRLKAFIANEYLPKCRTEFGCWSLPDGKERYTYLIKYHTTLPLTPEEITSIGMKELEKDHAEMDKIIKQVGFKGTRKEFLNYLHTDPKFYYTDKDSLLAGYDHILRAMEKKLPELFDILPKTSCEVKELPSYQSANAPTAYYNGGSKDGSRPGYFMANTYQLNTRPKYEMEALTYHEAVPGHHLQGSIAQELTGIPEFRKNQWFTAYGEGWALYSERLPKEVGFYSDPYSDFGRLIYDAWRAARLVVDVGLHYYRWDRQKALDFMAENFGGTDQNVVAEVDRYIAWPGQALGYKIGQLKILELRDKAQRELGARFKLPEFHDQVLNYGSIPLPVLEKKINDWITNKKRT